MGPEDAASSPSARRFWSRRPAAGLGSGERRADTVDAPIAADPVARALPVDETTRPDASLAGIPALVAEHAARGNAFAFDDRTEGHPIGDDLQRLVFELVRGGFAAADAQAVPGHRLHTRLRVEGTTLVLSTQTIDGGDGGGAIRTDAEHRARLTQRVAAAGGQVLVHRTAAGNWMAIVRLPL